MTTIANNYHNYRTTHYTSIFETLEILIISLRNMTVNARWQSRRSRSRAAVHAPNFYSSRSRSRAVAPMTSCFFPLKTWRHRSDSSVAGTRAIEIRYVNGSSGAGTTALSPGVHRHMYNVYWIVRILLYLYYTYSCKNLGPIVYICKLKIHA